MAKITFGYETHACSMRPPYVSKEYKFFVYEKGTVRLKRLVTEYEKINGEMTEKIISSESKKIIISLQVVEKIKKYLKSQKRRIDRLPKEILNHSCDGTGFTFNFMGKKISCANISRHNLDKNSNPEISLGDNAFFRPNVGIRIMKQENTVLEIFESVYKILKNYGVEVYSWKNFSCDWKMERKNLRIATWNVERLKHKRELEKIKNICNDLSADIFVLTETEKIGDEKA